MKAHCLFWFFAPLKEAPEWFKHEGEVELTWEKLQDLLNRGLKVKLDPLGNNEVRLWVSKTNFGQMG